MHALQYWKKGKRVLGFFIYDTTIAKGKKMKKLRLRPRIVMSQGYTQLYGSCEGLLLFVDWRGECYCYVFDPVTQDQVTMTFPGPGFVCGFFYHPLTKKYNILYYNFPGYGSRKYFLNTLGSRVWRRIKSPPFEYVPDEDPPAIFNGALHWISSWNYLNVEEIPPCTCGVIVFDMNTEKFFTMPHPGDECYDRVDHQYMSLLTGDEHLFFLYTECFERYIDIWMLEDYSNWVWIKKWKLNLNLPEHPRLDGWGDAKFLRIQDGQLWLDCYSKGLFLYQLDNNTVKKLEGPPSGEHMSTTRHCGTFFTKSLIRLHQLFPDEIKD